MHMPTANQEVYPININIVLELDGSLHRSRLLCLYYLFSNQSDFLFKTQLITSNIMLAVPFLCFYGLPVLHLAMLYYYTYCAGLEKA